MNMMIKNMKLVEYKHCDCFLEYTNFKDNLGLMKKGMMESSRNYFLIHKNFLTMISINLFYCFEKVFTHMNTSMIRKNSTKRH